jgi:hypothetical protein
MSAINSAWSVVSTDALPMMASRLNVIGIHVELCLAQYFHEKIYLLNQRRYRKRFRTDRVSASPFVFFFSSTTIAALLDATASLSDGVNDPI